MHKDSLDKLLVYVYCNHCVYMVFSVNRVEKSETYTFIIIKIVLFYKNELEFQTTFLLKHFIECEQYFFYLFTLHSYHSNCNNQY